jgi:N-acetylglutamate synthase-like GNAT family acetyltransferase
MVIRSARQEDFSQIVDLAKELGLDYEGMDKDPYWVAEDAGRIVGMVGLKKHADCHELCALGVSLGYREKGLGQKLVHALLLNADRNTYLATVIPGFFEQCGFEKRTRFPASMKKAPEWCEGCPKELCTVMVRTFR